MSDTDGALRPAVFVDRDGTLIVERAYLADPDGVTFVPGAEEAIRRLKSAGFVVVIVTNQSGIARGLYDEGVLAEIHARMETEIEALGGRLAGIYHCPHAPEAGCDCRKPRAGLIARACRDLGIESLGAPMIGDRMSDLESARAAGCRPILVTNGYAVPREMADPAWRVVEVHRDLAEATDALLAASR